MHRYFEHIKHYHAQSIAALDLPLAAHQRRITATKSLSLLEDDSGEELVEYKLLDKALKDIGLPLEQDRYDSLNRKSAFVHAPARGIRAKPAPVPQPAEQRAPSREGGWSAVNTARATISVNNTARGVLQDA